MSRSLPYMTAFFADGVLGMQLSGACLGRRRPVLDGELHRTSLANARVPGHSWVKDLLVDSPNFVPLHVHGVLRGALLEHEVLQSLRSHATPHDALDSWEAGVVPALDVII